MLSLPELKRAVRILDEKLKRAKLDKLIQVDDESLVLSFRLMDGSRGPAARCHVLVGCNPATARLSELVERPKAPRTPPAFAQFLRARLGRAVCEGVRILNDDRQAVIALRGKEESTDILLSILGPRSNIYALDENGILLESMRPLARTRRTLVKGDAWIHPDTPPPAASAERWSEKSDDQFSEAVESHYQALEGEARDQESSRLVRSALDKEAGIFGRKLAARRRNLEAARGADEERRRGELLKGALDRIRRGATQVEVVDPETQASVSIPLDARLTPQENLAAIFKRYQKRTRAVTHLESQIEELLEGQRDHERMRQAFLELGEAPDPGALAAFAARPAVEQLLKRHRPKTPPRTSAPARSKKGLPARLQPRRYLSSDGLEIWVGRSDEGNDLLSTRLARGRDLFLHLDASPGSHVVLRTEGRPDPPSESLLEAAELAIHFSKQKNATRADVHVVPIANVRKPRGAKPGLVMVTGGKTLHLRRDPARLKRALQARIEE